MVDRIALTLAHLFERKVQEFSMQPDEITLAVDEENDGVDPVNHVYTRAEEYQNRSVYIGANHSLTAKDTVTLYRTAPKSNGNFKGVAKTSFKFSQDKLVDGVDGVAQITAPVIVEVSFSIPVGVTPADVLIARQRALALLDLDTVMDPLNNQLLV